MFIIRFIIGCVFFGCSLFAVKKCKAACKRVLCFAIAGGAAVALMTVLAFIPFENAFITFDSPESAYEYCCGFSKPDVELVVKGRGCDLIVDRQGNTDRYLIIPKVTDGWKVGIGSDTKCIITKISDGISVHVYRYKNTGDCFITVLNTDGGESVIADDLNTEFHPLKRTNETVGKTFVTYYGNVYAPDAQYALTVNGTRIVLNNT